MGDSMPGLFPNRGGICEAALDWVKRQSLLMPQIASKLAPAQMHWSRTMPSALGSRHFIVAERFIHRPKRRRHGLSATPDRIAYSASTAC